MLNTQATNAASQIEAAYGIAKLHAATDGAFDESLMRHWFDAAWEICADFSNFVYPPQQISMPVFPDENTGMITLRPEPTGPVSVYSGSRLITVLPADSRVFGGSTPSPLNLCCLCNLSVRYQIGEEGPCGSLPPSFVQAVARVFAYIVENRGDVEMDPYIITKSGAVAFLDVTYVL